MKFSGWGQYPRVDSNNLIPDTISDSIKILSDINEGIPRGCGRSYGDSALSKKSIITLTRLNQIINFNPDQNLLECYAGITIADILSYIVPRGFFLPVTPGTKFVTLGGAISSDVHGKNHHVDGCFSQWVKSLVLLLPSGEIIQCSQTQNTELFKAVCGGMGLIGIIISAQLVLKTIKSNLIVQKSIKTSNLEETIKQLDRASLSTYTVAWIDALDKKSPGKGVVYTGEHSDSGDLNYQPKIKISIPKFFPSSCLNPFTVKLFNRLIYFTHIKKTSIKHVSIEKFFYPLDSILNWNNMYGKKGFVQYQFVIPKTKKDALKEILGLIAESGKGSFLAVLKLLGKENENFLSFPMEGYTLALDFKFDNTVLRLLAKLDKIVVESGGRIYLTKDACMSPDTFRKTYPNLTRFKAIRSKHGSDIKLNSCQSRRLKI